MLLVVGEYPLPLFVWHHLWMFSLSRQDFIFSVILCRTIFIYNLNTWNACMPLKNWHGLKTGAQISIGKLSFEYSHGLNTSGRPVFNVDCMWHSCFLWPKLRTHLSFYTINARPVFRQPVQNLASLTSLPSMTLQIPAIPGI